MRIEMRIVRRLSSVALIAFGVTDCSNAFLQNDGFSEKLKAGCDDEQECGALQVEARQRVAQCRDNTIGYVKCDDARADELRADSHVENLRRSKQEAEEAERKAELERGRRAERAEFEEREREIEAKRREREKQSLTADLGRARETVRACESSVEARAARKRRMEMLRAQAPGAAVRRQCKPRTAVHSVAAECKDDNGFLRPCTKAVAGDVVGYDCPKTMDTELVQLGLYQLELLEFYPFPEDRGIQVSDEVCQENPVRVQELEQKLEALAAGEAKE